MDVWSPWLKKHSSVYSNNNSPSSPWWSLYNSKVWPGTANTVAMMNISSTPVSMATRSWSRPRLSRRLNEPRTPHEIKPKVCAKLRHSREITSHQFTFPVTWQDTGPASLRSVSLSRLDADERRAAAMTSAAATQASQARTLPLGWHVSHLWYFLNWPCSSSTCATLHIGNHWDLLRRIPYDFSISLYISLHGYLHANMLLVCVMTSFVAGNQGQGCLCQARGLCVCQMRQSAGVDCRLAKELPRVPYGQKVSRLKSIRLPCKSSFF